MKIPPLKTGQPVIARAKYGTMKGIIVVQDDAIFIAHNNEKYDGSQPLNLRGYQYGWTLGYGKKVGDTTTEIISIKKVGETEMSRATYRLKKDTPEFKKGAIFEENCDDGDQDFTLIDESYSKYENYDGDKPVGLARKAVTNEPTFFERVYPATETYLTKEDLALLTSFLKSKKTQKKGKK